MDPKLPERFTSIWMLFSVGLMLAAWRISNTLVPGSFSVMSNWFGFCRGVTISRSPSTTIFSISSLFAMSRMVVRPVRSALSPDENSVKKMAMTATKIIR